jgi:hypothetical protein
MDTNFETNTRGEFQFTLVNGQVTAEQAVSGKHVETVHIPKGATFAVGAGTITETIVGTHATEVIQFTAETANPALYRVSSLTETVTNPTTVGASGHIAGFSFATLDGVVTAEQVVTGDSATSTHSHNVPVPPGAQFAVNGTTITETTVHGHEIDVTSFVQSGPAGLYAIASHSQTFIPQGAATTALSVEPGERDKFTFGASGTVATVSTVHADGTVTTVTPDSHVTFTQLAPGFVEEIVTHGTHSQFEVFHDGNGDGIYTAIAHGDGSTVDLSGLQAQIAKIDSFL